MARICCVVGARPNFVKMAPILKALQARPEIEPVLVHTGQHYDEALSDIFFEEFGMPRPHVCLDVGKASPARQTGLIIEKFDSLLAEQKFDRTLVVGDVTSTAACAMASAKRWVPVDHVEAGLRSFDREMPEEINRLVTDAIADHFFVSEPSGVANLKNEGHADDKVHFVGNVMIDTLMRFLPRARGDRPWTKYNLKENGYALVTLHRPRNVDDPTRRRGILKVLQEIGQQIPVVFPMHPRTRQAMGEDTVVGIRVLPPLGYVEFIGLMSAARFVITDSGGMQEETTVMGVPCLTVRPNTERPITCEIGSSTLVGEEPEQMLGLAREIMAGNYKLSHTPELWDGHAAERIVDILAKLVGEN